LDGYHLFEDIFPRLQTTPQIWKFHFTIRNLVL